MKILRKANLESIFTGSYKREGIAIQTLNVSKVFCWILWWKLRNSKYYITGTGTYSELCQAFQIECFVKVVDGWKALTIFAKHAILGVWQVSVILNYHQKFLTFRFHLKMLRIYKRIMKYVELEKGLVIFA